MAFHPFSHVLPWWAIRSVETTSGLHTVMINVDGTLCMGFRASGVDLFDATDDEMDLYASAVDRALNALGEDCFLQADWRLGRSYNDVIADYGHRGKLGNDVLQELRRARVKLLRGSPLMRGQLTYYVGQRAALGKFSPGDHRKKATGLSSLLGAFGLSGADPQALSLDRLLEAASDLADVAERCMSALTGAGIQTRELSPDELLYDAFAAVNPESAATMPPPKLVDQAERLHPDDLAKAGYSFLRPFTLREQMPLGDMTITDDTIALDDPPVLHRVFSLQRFDGDESSVDSLHRAMYATSLPYRLVCTFRATDKAKVSDAFIQKQKLMNAVAMDGAIRNVRADIAQQETADLIALINSTEQRLFEGSLQVVLSAPNAGALEQASKSITTLFSEASGRPVVTAETRRQQKAWLGTLPCNGHMAPRTLPFLTSNATDYLPSFVPSEGDDDADLVYHTRLGGLRRLSFSPSKVNRNGLIFGKSGSGKSFHISSVLEQLALAEGNPLTIVDVQGFENSNYRVMADIFGGSFTALYGDDNLAFNPFPAYDVVVKQTAGPDGKIKKTVDDKKVERLANLVCMMAVPDYTTSRNKALQNELAREAILRAYHASYNPPAGTPPGPPIISDVVSALQAYKPAGDKVEYVPIARDMFLQLETWTRPGPRSRLLNRRTTFTQNTKFQVFDFFGMDKDPDLATILLMVVSETIWDTVMATSKDKTSFVVFDEVWKMLTHPVASELVKELYKTIRKHGGAAWAVTQSARDIMLSPVATGIRENAEFIFIHQVVDVDAVATYCDLNSRQRALVSALEFKKGEHSEILLYENSTKRAALLRYKASRFENWVNTTNPADIAKRRQLEATEGLLGAIRQLAERA
jgi:hypothetical protein